MNVKNEKVQVTEEPQDETVGSVDQIKKKYGLSLTGDTSAAKMDLHLPSCKDFLDAVSECGKMCYH